MTKLKISRHSYRDLLESIRYLSDQGWNLEDSPTSKQNTIPFSTIRGDAGIIQALNADRRIYSATFVKE